MAQISKGWQYQPSGEYSQVTAENLNSHVDNATLVNGAIVEQDLVTFANNEDLLLLSQADSLVSISKQNFLGATSISNGYLNFGNGFNTYGARSTISSTGNNAGLSVTLSDNDQNNTLYTTFWSPWPTGVQAPITECYGLKVRSQGLDEAYSVYEKSSLNVDFTAKLVVHGRNKTNGFVPSGTIVAFAGQNAPSGWIVCDGRTLDGTQFATPTENFTANGDALPIYYDLWLVLGTTYGGTGQSSFKIPDLRGEFIRGYDHGNGADPRVFGSKQKDLLKAHKHISSNNDCQDYSWVNGWGTGVTNTWCDTNGVYSGGGCSLTGDGTHPEQVVNGVPTVGHETRPRNIALNYIIKI